MTFDDSATGALLELEEFLEKSCRTGGSPPRSSLEPMIYRFGPFELDSATVELRARGELLSLEPQVFALLALLLENHDRLVSKDEIIEKVWDGRVVSDAAVASRVKSARQALGDDGQAQRFIRTARGRGFRFVAKINVLRGSAGHCGLQSGADPGDYDIGSLAHQLERVSRPSIAVLPFRMIGRLSGAVEVSDRRLLIVVELVDTLDSRIVWADRFSGRMDDVHSMRDEIRSRVLMALDIQIPMHEANLAGRSPHARRSGHAAEPDRSPLLRNDGNASLHAHGEG